MLSETRLRNEASVPDIAGYCNVQSNRRGSSEKSSNGGVSILYRNHLEGISVHRGDDFAAQTIRLEEMGWVFISFYVEHGTMRENTPMDTGLTWMESLTGEVGCLSPSVLKTDSRHSTVLTHAEANSLEVVPVLTAS